MPESSHVINIIKNNYSMNFQRIEFNRDGGNFSYIVFADRLKYFLKIIRQEFMDTALQSVEIHLYLAKNHFPVPPIIFTKEGAPYIRTEEPDGEYLYIMYDYIEGQEPALDDAEKIGALVGKFHRTMQDYIGKLTVRSKYFFIDRYIEILRKKHYPKADEFEKYGNDLWEKVKDLPRGYCHCDLYRGNLHMTSTGDMYILDFDTSCNAFPMYDVMMVCNGTDYFDYDYNGYGKSKDALERFLKGYLQYCSLNQTEIAAFYDLLAVYHFQLQATIIEIHGLDCVDEEFFDKQLDWLLRWREQCEQKVTLIGKIENERGE